MKYNAEQVAFMLHEAIDANREYKSWHCSTQHLMALVEKVVAEEREAIAQMIEDAPALVEFAQNDKGGCLMCGFTPKLAAEFIRARGQA
jgi:hypothetical protein